MLDLLDLLPLLARLRLLCHQLRHLLLLLLRCDLLRDRIGAKRQHLAQLTSCATDGAAQARVTEQAANSPAQWATDLA